MTYNNQTGLTYTQMCIWIDEHVYTDDCDEEKLYQYLYHLSNMLANQGAYFNCAADYDQFALFSASRLFMRLKNPKQFQQADSGKPIMKQIKSILNYMKTVLYPYKVDFEAEFRKNKEEVDTIYTGGFDLGAFLSDEANIFDRINFSFSVGDIPKIVAAHLSKIPYKKHSPEWTNIYISCMLTLIDSVTLTRTVTKQLNGVELNPKIMDKVYSELRKNDPVLFHLDSSMSTYIKVLVNELRKVISAELTWTEGTYISSEAVMKELIMSTIDLESEE